MFDRLKQTIAKLGGPSEEERAARARAAKKDGDDRLKAGDHQAASRHYRAAIAADSRMARAHFALGYTLSEQGRPLEAIPALKTCLALDPNDLDALYVLGTLYVGQGSPTLAIPLFEAVLERDPKHAFATADLCLAQVQLGVLEGAETVVQRGLDANPSAAHLHFLQGNLKLSRHYAEQASRCFERAVALDPTLAEAHHNLGLARQSLGLNAEALNSQDLALRYRPLYPAALLARARVLNALGRREEASAGFEQSLAALMQAQPTAEVQFDMAAVLVELERPLEALERLDAALLLRPDFADAHLERAMILDSLERGNESLAALDHYLALRKDLHEKLVDVTGLLQRRGHLSRALQLYEEALEADSDYPGAISNYGSLLQLAHRYDDALAAYDRALQTAGQLFAAHSNRGSVLMDLGRHREALLAFEEALRIQPDSEEVRYNEGLCRLSLGELEKGWEGFEWRWKSALWRKSQKFYGARQFTAERWLGHVPIAGRTILLHPEQGLGDTIQFCRYATELSAMGAKVVLEVQPALKDLLSDLAGVDRLIVVGEPYPPHDLQCPLMSLPLGLETTEATIPAAGGYLGSSPDHVARVKRWRGKLSSRSATRVGVVWSGNASHKNDVHRSIPFVEFSRVMSDRHEFFCLQNEVRDTDLASLSAFPRMQLLCDELTNFADTAALIANLDLVVSVDTSVAHVAGALGKTVWLLLPANPDWRWMLDRQDTPWYSRMRLFRQPSLGDWKTVLEAVRSELDRCLESAEAAADS